MSWNRRSLRHFVSLAASSLLLATVACSNSANSSALASQQAANAGNFTTTYFLGDSLTAGYQSGSLIATSQVHGWAPLVAQQANFNIALPLIAPPGAPNQLTLVHLAGPVIGQLPGTTTGRENFSLQPTNVGVPGALTNDVLNTLPHRASSKSTSWCWAIRALATAWRAARHSRPSRPMRPPSFSGSATTTRWWPT